MQETLKELRAMLRPRFGQGEAEAIIRYLFHHLKGWNATDMVINADRELSDYARGQLRDMARRVLGGEPVQYVTGEAYFYGMDLKVTPDVLIPRVETQELVDMIVDRYRDTPDLDVLDVGTGSGCIAIALARNLPFAKVTAIDLSSRALDVARDNGTRLKTKVRWVQADVFGYSPAPHSLDIIVSNPPYIAMSEQRDMESNVLDHEPWSALFVPDDDPLRFYRRICEIGRVALRPGGTLWFELNARFAKETAELARSMGYEVDSIAKDIAGRDRFLILTNPKD